MPEITIQEAKEFLENITETDRVAIIHHDDGDGFCSGILYYDWCKNKGAEIEQFTYLIGKSSLSKLNLEKFNKIIACDLSPDFMAEEFEQIKDKEVFYADHHPRNTPIPKEILELVTTSQGYIPSSRTAGELTGLKPWLSLTGTITDAGDLHPENQEFIDEHLKQINMTLEEFKEEVSSVITNFLVYFDKDLDKAFEILEKIGSIEELKGLKKYSEPVENEIQEFVEEYERKKEKLGNINFYYIKPNFAIKGVVGSIISRQNDDEIFIFASPRSYDDTISLSSRSQNRKYDMSEILKIGVEGLSEAISGGHKGAAGGQILKKDLEKFKENIRRYIS
jgi:single-stranded DNA-specific DHH superfamily exonuclease